MFEVFGKLDRAATAPLQQLQLGPLEYLVAPGAFFFVSNSNLKKHPIQLKSPTTNRHSVPMFILICATIQTHFLVTLVTNKPLQIIKGWLGTFAGIIPGFLFLVSFLFLSHYSFHVCSDTKCACVRWCQVVV